MTEFCTNVALQKQSFADALQNNFANFTGKHLCWSIVLNIKKRLQHRCFPEICEICKKTFFFRTPPVAACYISLVSIKNLLTESINEAMQDSTTGQINTENINNIFYFTAVNSN